MGPSYLDMWGRSIPTDRNPIDHPPHVKLSKPHKGPGICAPGSVHSSRPHPQQVGDSGMMGEALKRSAHASMCMHAHVFALARSLSLSLSVGLLGPVLSPRFQQRA